MKRQISLKTCLHHLAFIAVIASLLAVTSPSIAKEQIAVESTSETAESKEESLKVAEALKELLASMNIKTFTYRTEDRADPFLPFISEKVMQEVAETKQEVLTGMRQFEPGQLTLVAIMFTENSPMAMVEDSSHKGYLVRKGTKIGRSGIISDILPNQIIIKQLSYSMTSKKKYKTVEMTLRKEGEK